MILEILFYFPFCIFSVIISFSLFIFERKIMALTFDKVRSDTIAAIATAASEAGIGIIRVSGPEAIPIVSTVYCSAKGQHCLEQYKANSIHFGYIVESGGNVENKIDEVMVSVMKAPHSYTTEDTVEINTHGGAFLMNRILSLVLDAGCRLAQPGEFTKRAFLGGRIDLSEAEAVMDLISSQSEFARKTSLAQLEGSVSNEVKHFRSEVLYEIAFIESALDDPENYSLDGYPQALREKCTSLIRRMDVLLARSEQGRILKDGIRTVIVGKPNAGKSSLLNRMAGEERAIVTDVAGTTRDTLSESVRIGNVLLNITDTAGIHNTEDKIEQIGIQRAKAAAEQADLILFIMDMSREISEEDREIALFISRKMQEGIHGIVLLNKTDLPAKMTETDAASLFSDTGDDTGNHALVPSFITCSMRTQEGMDRLEQCISDMFHSGELMQNNEVLLTNVRHREAMRDARNSLALVVQSIDNGMSEDFFSIDLMNAYESLGLILGESVEDDLVEEIFSKFCLGK